ncbi:MAG: hypothetical protein CM15mV105_220 [uncultured marine virus]|nr:MAG: hypothetical protein CM15mV105_220 [uncultured marine virus]
MSYVLFISENKLKDSTAIGGNVDIEFILPYLKVAQKKHIERVLGTDLLKHYKLKYQVVRYQGLRNLSRRIRTRRFSTLGVL